MSLSVGQIQLDVSAGTSKFVLDMEQAKAKIKEFGETGVGEHKAVSAAMKAMEGNFFNNSRAADAFIATTLKLGPILQAAFPVIGAVAFVGVIVEVGKKVNEFFKGIQEAPAKNAQAWRTLIQTVQSTNDQLDTANARLEADIAKLQGKRENNLAIALSEAKEAADKLGASLEKDVDSLNKLLKEQQGNFFENLVTGRSSVANEAMQRVFGGEHGFGGVYAEIQNLRDQEEIELEKLKNTKPTAGAIHLIGQSPDDLAKAGEQNIRNRYAQLISSRFSTIASGIGKILQNPDLATDDKESLQYAQRLAMDEAQRTLKTNQNTTLTEKNSDLETDKANKALVKPIQDKIADLKAQLKGIQDLSNVIGGTEAQQVAAKSTAAYEKAIEELNKALGDHKKLLTAADEAQIKSLETQIAQSEADKENKSHFDELTKSIQERITAQKELTAAVGQSYASSRSAYVASETAKAIQAHANDTDWQKKYAGNIGTLQTGFGNLFDASHGEQTAKTLDSLTKQTLLEQALAKTQVEGAEAVRQVELAYKLKDIAINNNAEDAKKLMDAEIQLYNATQDNHNAEIIAKINDETKAQQKLAQAVFGGAEALRQQAEANKYAETLKNGGKGTADAQGHLDEAEHQRQINDDAAKLITTYSDQLAKLQQMKAALEANRATLEATGMYETALRDIENDRLRILVQQTLQLKTAQAGVKAFFEEMQEDSKSAANIVYDSLNSALDKVSDQFAKLFTGQKTSFKKMFQSLGEEITKETTKALLQKGLGALGAHFGLGGKATGKVTFRAGDPGHVIVDNMGGSQQQGGFTAVPNMTQIPGGSAGLLQSIAGSSGGIGAFLAKLFSGVAGGAGGNGLTEAVSSSISYMADGGDAYAGKVYGVAEAGEAEIVSPKNDSRITPLSKLKGGDTYHSYTIDARGAALGSEARIAQAIDAAHMSAVTDSIRANHQRSVRTPQKSK